MGDLPTKRSYKNAKVTSTANKEKRVNVNKYLTYDVLSIVFKYLNGMELSNVSMVCRSWLEVANDEKRTRGGDTFLIDYDIASIRAHYKAQITQKLQSKPALGLFFKSCHPEYRKDCHCTMLPKDCAVVTLGTYGVIFNNEEMEEASGNIVCAFLPKLPGTTIEVISCTKNFAGQYYSQLFAAFEECENDRPKCLLFFCNLEGRDSAKSITKMLLERCDQTVKPSVWGGVVQDLYVCNSKNSKSENCPQLAYSVAVILTGSVDSWSVVIDKKYCSKQLVEMRLKAFKSHISLRKHSMGFMFACCERGQNMFDECNVESSIFKKYFPNIPLVGCFGDGEFGHTTEPNKTSNVKDAHCYKERSTVFLIVTYG
ncbi:F-box only protein 22-like [Xylocopa sonorina]|uniref:F-box only protein 22-like n=1 Tax=Xylocopa sonorina TaxID=1818115 RepID=UPI00403B368F